VRSECLRVMPGLIESIVKWNNTMSWISVKLRIFKNYFVCAHFIDRLLLNACNVSPENAAHYTQTNVHSRLHIHCLMSACALATHNSTGCCTDNNVVRGFPTHHHQLWMERYSVQLWRAWVADPVPSLVCLLLSCRCLVLRLLHQRAVKLLEILQCWATSSYSWRPRYRVTDSVWQVAGRNEPLSQ